MIYYHGTNVYFEEFDLSKSGIYKDFGRGIYLSEGQKHAADVAIWKNGNMHMFSSINVCCQK